MTARALHDHVLLSILFDWEEQSVTINYKGYAMTGAIRAEGVTDLHVPCMKSWGRSVHINMTAGPERLVDGLYKLEIEMQSGDTISLIARNIEAPLVN